MSEIYTTTRAYNTGFEDGYRHRDVIAQREQTIMRAELERLRQAYVDAMSLIPRTHMILGPNGELKCKL